jgi:hypothetical protein
VAPQNPNQSQYEALPATHSLVLEPSSFPVPDRVTAALHSVNPLRGSTIATPSCPGECFKYDITLTMAPMPNNPLNAAMCTLYFSTDGAALGPQFGNYFVNQGQSLSVSQGERLIQILPTYKYIVIVAEYYEDGPVRGTGERVKARTNFFIDYKPR